MTIINYEDELWARAYDQYNQGHYQKRILLGPLMDWIDIHMQVPRVEYQKLRDMRPGETSAEIRIRVEAARERQRNRIEGTDIASNADMRPATITFTDLFTIERRASPNEKVPIQTEGHFQIFRLSDD